MKRNFKEWTEERKQRTITSGFVKKIHCPYKKLMPKVVPYKGSKKVTSARKEIKSSERVALWIK